MHQSLPTVFFWEGGSQPLLSLPQNYFQKLEKLAAAEEVHGDGPKKERTKLITPQVAKLEHTYKPGKRFFLHVARTSAGEGWWAGTGRGSHRCQLEFGGSHGATFGPKAGEVGSGPD